jgi:hypothetical protein
LSPSELLESDQLLEEGITLGREYGRCETDCSLCPGVNIDRYLVYICKCKCHKAEKHIKERIIRFCLYKNTDFNEGLHILDKNKRLEHRIEKILISRSKVDYNKKSLISNIRIQNIFDSEIVFIDKSFFKSDKLLYYELKELTEEAISVLFKFAYTNVCSIVTIRRVILN